MVKRRSWVAMLLLLLLVVGCATAKTQSLKETEWKTLMSLKQAYDQSFKTLASLDQAGKLPVQAKAQAIKLGNVYMVAHNAAVNQMLAGQSVNLQTVQTAFDGFMTAITPYLKGVK